MSEHPPCPFCGEENGNVPGHRCKNGAEAFDEAPIGSCGVIGGQPRGRCIYIDGHLGRHSWAR